MKAIFASKIEDLRNQNKTKLGAFKKCKNCTRNQAMIKAGKKMEEDIKGNIKDRGIRMDQEKKKNLNVLGDNARE